MKIIVHLCDNTPTNCTSLALFDYYYAYRQSANKNNNYQSDSEIFIGHNLDFVPDAINIAFYHMPTKPIQLGKFDFIIVDAGQHHLEVCTAEMHKAFVEIEECYFLTGSVVSNDYPKADKLIPFPYTLPLRDTWFRPFYPQYYDRHSRSIQDRKKHMIFINGQNRSNRQYMADLLSSTGINIRRNNLGSTSKLIDSFFESQDDTAFRDFVNDYCCNQDDSDHVAQNYYDRSIKVGIDGKFGPSVPGFFLLDEYYQYYCVIFPETAWLNDEVWITEKFSKCAIAKSIPWPIAGANTDVLYNDLGFLTAWNLLPENLQAYNYEPDHAKRYRMCAEAIKWMADHPEILISDRAQALVQHNYEQFFTNTLEAMGPIKFDQIIKNIIKKKWPA